MQNKLLNKTTFILIYVCSVFFICISSTAQAFRNQGTIITQEDSIIYLPSSYDTSQNKYFSLVAIFSPSGDANYSIRFWTPLAEKYQLILYASKVYRNDMEFQELSTKSNLIYNSIAVATSNYRVDTKKIIYTGISGGGSFSYFMHYYTPSVAYGLIINTGRMWEEMVYNPIASNIEDAKQHMNNQVKVAMLASPTDFRYSHMIRDKALIDKLGWTSLWLEFNGGHTLAPYETYYQAIDWIFQDSNTTTPGSS